MTLKRNANGIEMMTKWGMFMNRIVSMLHMKLLTVWANNWQNATRNML